MDLIYCLNCFSFFVAPIYSIIMFNISIGIKNNPLAINLLFDLKQHNLFPLCNLWSLFF